MLTWILDIGVLLLFVFLIYRGYKNGFVRSLIVMVGNVLALIFAFLIGSYLAGVIYDMSVRNAIVNYISGAVGNAANVDVSALLPGIFNAMPDYLSSVVTNAYGSEAQLINQIQQALSSSGTSVAITVADTIIKPVFIMLAQALIGIIVFIILSIIVGIVSRLFKGVNRIPILGKANEILGGAVGILQATIYTVIIVLIITFIISLTSNLNETLNTSVIDKTYLFKYFYNMKLFNTVIGI